MMDCDVDSAAVGFGSVKLPWKRCPKRPRLDVFNDVACDDYEMVEGGYCKFEMRERRIDGFVYCTK